jgi:hypothetical protein
MTGTCPPPHFPTDGGKPSPIDETVEVSRFSTPGGSRTKRIVASFGIAVGLVLVFVGLASAVTGKDAQKLPKEIESITPVRSATQVQQQEQIRVDLIAGYTGVLIVNGIELPTVGLDTLAQVPGQQVSLPPEVIFEPGNYTLSFTPTKGAGVEKFATGVNTVTVVYWKITEGRKFAKPGFTWQFDVV